MDIYNTSEDFNFCIGLLDLGIHPDITGESSTENNMKTHIFFWVIETLM